MEDHEDGRRFLVREYLNLSLHGAFAVRGSGIRLYADEIDEADRDRFKEGVRGQLRSLVEAHLARGKVKDRDHHRRIVKLAEFMRKARTKDERPVLAHPMPIGPAQKALNLALKYWWCAGWASEPLHCPLDSVVLGAVGRTSKGNGWTTWTALEQYLEALDAVRQHAAAEGLTIARWELRTFEKRRGV